MTKIFLRLFKKSREYERHTSMDFDFSKVIINFLFSKTVESSVQKFYVLSVLSGNWAIKRHQQVAIHSIFDFAWANPRLIVLFIFNFWKVPKNISIFVF